MVGVVFLLFFHHVTNIVPLKPGHLIWMLKDLLPKFIKKFQQENLGPVNLIHRNLSKSHFSPLPTRQDIDLRIFRKIFKWKGKMLTFSHPSHSWSPSAALNLATRVSPATSSERRRWRRWWRRRSLWWVLRSGSGWCGAGWRGRRSSSSRSCPHFSSGRCSMGCAGRNCLFVVLWASFVCLFAGAEGSKHHLDQVFWSWAVLASEALASHELPSQTWPLSQDWLPPFFHNISEMRVSDSNTLDFDWCCVQLKSFLRFILSQFYGFLMELA